MPRIVITDPFARRPPPTATADILTPHPEAARACGVPHIKLESLADRALADAGIRCATNVEARLLLKQAVRTVTTADDSAAYASRIREILETTIRTGIDPALLIASASPRVQVFGRSAAAYISILRQQGSIDPAGRMHEAAKLKPAKLPLIIYGYFRGRSEEIEFIDKSAGDGSVYYLPCGDGDIFAVNRRWAERLGELGWEIVNDISEPRMPASAFIDEVVSATNSAAYSFINIDAECRFVLGRVKERIIAGTMPEEIALVCNDPAAYAGPVAAIAKEYGLPVRFAHSVTLGETPFGRFVSLILEAVGSELDFEPTARMLMHPLAAVGGDDLWRMARKTKTRGLDAWIAQNAELQCLRWPEAATLPEWESLLLKALAKTKAAKTVVNSARDISAFHCFTDTLREQASAAPDERLTFDAFAAVVHEILNGEKTKFDPAQGGVAVYDPKSLFGAAFSEMYYIGMAEGVVPTYPTDNPVIDFYERKRLAETGVKFESAADVARWEAAQFYFTLLAANRRAVFTFPQTMEGVEKIPSPFIERMGLTLESVALDAVSSIEEFRRQSLRHAGEGDDDVLVDARRRFGIEMQREDRPAQTEFDGVIGRSVDARARRWSVSQLTAFGQCAFRWFAGRVLRLEPAEEMADELDARTRGSLYHKVLEIAVERAKDKPDLRAAVLSELETAMAEAERDESLALPQLADWELQRPDHLKTLREAVESEDFLRPGSVVLAVEQEYKAEWCGLEMTGSIDRVDETPDGLIAIDYKTSSQAPKGIKDVNGVLKTDVQLPLYTKVALPELYPNKRLGTGAYYSLTKGKMLKEAGMDAIPELEAFAERLKDDLANGRFPVAPDVKRLACEYCDFEAVCRIGPRLERNTNDAGFE